MNRRLAASAALLGLLAVSLASAGAATAQQKYRFREVGAPGDVSAVEELMEMTITVQVTLDGQQSPPLPYLTRDRQQYRERLLALEGGRPAEVERTYTVARGEETGPQGKPVEKVSSLQGKTVLVRLKNGRIVVTPTTGTLSLEDRDALTNEFSEGDLRFFPEKEMAPGESWVVDTQKSQGAFKGADRVDLRGRFEDVVEFQGRRCARFTLELEVVGRPDGVPVPLVMKGTGTGYYALDLDRPLLLEMSGPVTMKGEVKEGNTVTRFDGTGTFKQRQAIQWQRVGGKSVPG